MIVALLYYSSPVSFLLLYCKQKSGGDESGNKVIIGVSLSKPHLVSTAAVLSVYSNIYIVHPPHVITRSQQ